MADLSVIIPARNEAHLARTIESVLANSEADTEVIAVCDGYWPDPPIQDHPRVNLIHHSEARGQRTSINEAARIARGRFIMKLDAHCCVSPGFDRVLIRDHRDGVTQVPRMYNLDVETFTAKEHKRTDYMFIGWNDKDEMRALYYGGSDYRRWHRRSQEFDATMACMGPGWFLSKEDFWRQGGCDENHGGSAGWGQQGIEVSLKAWLLGEGLYVNKRCWFAHWFRGGSGPGFPYPIGGREIARARAYSADIWTHNRVPGQKRTLRWLVEKFRAPGWENYVWPEGEELAMPEPAVDINGILYRHIHAGRRHPNYRGVRVLKMPSDLQLYHEVIQEKRPRWIIETGTRHGGSCLYFQDQLDLLGEGGRVVTIDNAPNVQHPDPRITYITANSRDRGVIARVRGMVGSDTCMVVLDSNHARQHVKWELYLYSPLVTPGQYLVIEDCQTYKDVLYGPGQARDWFLGRREGRSFEQTNLDRKFLVGMCLGGWLQRKV